MSRDVWRDQLLKWNSTSGVDQPPRRHRPISLHSATPARPWRSVQLLQSRASGLMQSI
jgi:hypothetical protein